MHIDSISRVPGGLDYARGRGEMKKERYSLTYTCMHHKYRSTFVDTINKYKSIR